MFKLRNIKIDIFYLFLFCSILCCNSIYMSSGLKLIWQLLLMGLFILSLNDISKSYDDINKISNILLFSTVFSIIIILFLVFNYIQSPFNIIYNVFLLLIDPLMLFVLFVSQLNHNSCNKLFYIFENIMVMLSIISLVFWMLANIGIPTNMSKAINFGAVSNIPGYFGLDFLAQGRINFFGINIFRNTGIFYEPPMYNYVLCIAFLIELFLKKHICRWKLLILIITILSTTSTTGLFIIIPSILYKSFFSSGNNLYKIIILSLIPVVIFVLYFILNNKIGDINNGLSSYNSRKRDIIACIYAWKQHIILGNGLDNTAPISDYGYTLNVNGMSVQSSGGSNGIFMVLATGGIYYALFYLIPTILYSLKSYKTFAVALFTFVLLTYTVIYNSFICIILLSYFWAYSLYYKRNNNINL